MSPIKKGQLIDDPLRVEETWLAEPHFLGAFLDSPCRKKGTSQQRNRVRCISEVQTPNIPKFENQDRPRLNDF